MHLEIDYTKEYEEEMAIMESADGAEELDPIEQEAVEELYKLIRSQYKTIPNPEKKQTIIQHFELLSEVAAIQGGSVTLDIDDDDRKAVLTYWGKQIIQTGDGDSTKKIITSLLNYYDLFFIESKNDGVLIRIITPLYDRVQIKDESATIKTLKAKMNSIRQNT